MVVQSIDKESNLWDSCVQVYDFFSVFLERHVLNISHLDLSFMPVEYLDLLIASTKTDDGGGYLVLLMMLFTEYYQENRTGVHKIVLPEEKYVEMGNQFLVYCHCEGFRRQGIISYLSEEHLFDPNFKTTVIVDNCDGLRSLMPLCDQWNMRVKQWDSLSA